MNCPKCDSEAIYRTSDPFRGRSIVCVQCGTITPWAYQFDRQRVLQAEQDRLTLQQMTKDISRKVSGFVSAEGRP